MSGPLYKIRRSGDMEPTIWIGATGCKRRFDPNIDEFIVDEIEMIICLHHGNFKLLGPADKGDVHPAQPTDPALITSPVSIFTATELPTEPVEENDKDDEDE